MRVETRRIHSQPSWLIRNDEVELAVTQLGGHMAPVTFYRASRRPVQPYYISPWQDERVRVPAPVLRPLRGDFFCLPFGEISSLSAGSAIRHMGKPAAGDGNWKARWSRAK